MLNGGHSFLATEDKKTLGLLDRGLSEMNKRPGTLSDCSRSPNSPNQHTVETESSRESWKVLV